MGGLQEGCKESYSQQVDCIIKLALTLLVRQHDTSSPQKAKSFQDSPSHRILRHMHEALNIDESKN